MTERTKKPWRKPDLRVLEAGAAEQNGHIRGDKTPGNSQS
jgi:hypothetical protein